jgi:hypothetical protein
MRHAGILDIKRFSFEVDDFGKCIPDHVQEPYFGLRVRYYAAHQRKISQFKTFGVPESDDNDKVYLCYLQAMCKIGYKVWCSFAAPHLTRGNYACGQEWCACATRQSDEEKLLQIEGQH